MKKSCLLLLLFLALTVMPAIAQTKSIEPEKEANIRHLLQIIGTEKVQQNMTSQMLAALKPTMTRLANGDPQAGKIIDRMGEIMTAEFQKADFTGPTILLYDKYFSNDDITGLIRFYESPVGQKSIQVLPALAQESMKNGVVLGQSILPKVMAQLGEEFPELKNALKAQQGKP